MGPGFPDVAAELEGWRLAEESVETLFELTGVRVRGATRRFEDERTRTAVRDVTGGVDREWRFVAATGLAFEPALPSGATPVILPAVRREARTAFVERLEERGLRGVTRRGTEQVRVRGGAQAQAIRVGAADPDDGVPVTGWVCVWHDSGEVFVVTGGYPERPLADVLSLAEPPETLERDADDYREEFFDFLQSVGHSG